MEARVADELCLLPPVRNSPRIIEVLEAEGTTTYNIVCEQKVFCKTNIFHDALYFCFAVYYMCNLEYPKPVYNLLCFFQDCILKYLDSLFRATNYVAIVTDINRYVSQ